MKLSTIRDLLNKNKIFFDVIVASLLSFMAIYISIQANKIADAQTKIMEQENLPQLEIRMTQDYNEKIKIYDNNVWLFFNRGGKLSDFDTRDYSFFKFTAINGSKIDSLKLPLYSYLNMRGTLTGESDGLIFQIDNAHNGVKEVELRNSLMNFGYFEIQSYMEITYTDIFDKKHAEYFRISPGPGVSKISEKRWKEIENSFTSANTRYTFPQIETTQIIEMLKKNNSR